MAAGLGFKTFVSGDVLSAADTNGYLMQGVLVFASAAARTSAITSPQEGQMSYLKDTDVTQYYTGSAWANIGGGAAATSYALLNTGGTALTGATSITVSSLSGYNKMFVTIEGASTAGTNADYYIKLNSASTNYRDQYNFVAAYSTYSSDNQGVSSDTTKIFIGYGSSTAASVVRSNLVIDGANSSGVKTYQHWSGGSAAAGNQQYNVVGGGIYTDSNVISSITILTTGGSNFDAGTLYIYGAN